MCEGVTSWFHFLLQALDWVVQDLPILHYCVTNFEVDDLPLTHISLIPIFLESAPNLKVVFITI